MFSEGGFVMAFYDYGLRGPRDTTEPRRFTRHDYEYDYGVSSDRRLRPSSRARRVTAPYNLDYVRERGPAYPRNALPYGGEWPGQMGGEEMYRPPYITQGGTRTRRGVPPPPRYDYRDFGPTYGGRYPDEL